MYIHPIETEYKGYHFRSRLEARWAVFFDEMGVDWIYEPDGFELSNGAQYLPDFYLPAHDWYVEVKIDRPRSELEMRVKVEQMVYDTHAAVLVLQNVPPPPRDDIVWDFPILYYNPFDVNNPVHMRRIAIKDTKDGVFVFDTSTEDIAINSENSQVYNPDDHINYKLLETAYNAARRARFGTGENKA